MKTVVVSLHSFVDVITNSSSELFICETKKSVQAVKEVLIELAKLHNKKQELVESSYGEVSVDSLFTGHFREPEVATFSFNFHQYPRASEWISMFGNNFYSYGFSYERTPTHPVLEAAHEKSRAWHQKNPSPPWADKEKLKGKEYKAADKLYWAHHKKSQAAGKEIYAEWNKMVFEITLDLYKWVAKENNVDLSKLGKASYTTYGGDFGKVSFAKANKKIAKFIDEIDNAVSWGYTFKKGDVFLHSAGDNSVPYGFWPDIESAFGNVQRRHLG